MQNALMKCNNVVRIFFLMICVCVFYGHAVYADGEIDMTFNSRTGPDYTVKDVEILQDGKMMISGAFDNYKGVSRNSIARINADASLDVTFDPGSGPNGNIANMAIQSDGKIVIVGGFTTFNGVPRNRIARLNTDGTVDTSFNPGNGLDSYGATEVVIQADGKILIGGMFYSYDGMTRNCIARINIDGSLDTAFAANSGEMTYVGAISLQSDGKIIVGGDFTTTVGGVTRNNIARLNVDGSFDDTFNSGVGTDAEIWTTGLQSDGKILISGFFTSYNGTSRAHIARLNNDGSLDVSFDPGAGIGGYVESFIQQGNEIIIGGDFSTYNGVARGRIARINSDGSLDVSFDPGSGANNSIYCMAAQLDGRIVVGGYFTYYNNIARNYIVRINATTSDESLSETLIPHEFNGGGTARGWNGDDTAWDYTLPFAFNFYGTNYTNIKIGSNGLVCLDNAFDCGWYPDPDLTNTDNGPVIVPLGIDLKTDTNPENDIYITENVDHVIVRWSATEYDATDNIGFEVVLYDNGNIKFNYDTNPDLSYGAVVGIANGNGVYYVNSAYNGSTNFDLVDTSAWGNFTQDNDNNTTGTNVANNLTISVSENLTLDCGSSIDLDNGTLLIAGSPQTNATTCTVTTNDQDGYTLSLTNDRGANNTLYHETKSATQDGQIQDKTPWNSAAPNAIQWANTGLGFGILSSTATKNETWWGTANDCNDTAQLYAGIPQSDTSIMQHDAYSNAQTNTTICYKLDIPSTQISGEYTGSVTYTATGRP